MPASRGPVLCFTPRMAELIGRNSPRAPLVSSGASPGAHTGRTSTRAGTAELWSTPRTTANNGGTGDAQDSRAVALRGVWVSPLNYAYFPGPSGVYAWMLQESPGKDMVEGFGSQPLPHRLLDAGAGPVGWETGTPQSIWGTTDDDIWVVGGPGMVWRKH